jgi:DNA (cytosine-5)-methyltransferase 1
MARVLGDLAALGYDAEWKIISAAEVGAPHRRERVWIVAYPQSARNADWQKRTRWAVVDQCGEVMADTDELRLAQRIVFTGICGNAQCAGTRQDIAVDGEYTTDNSAHGEGIRRGDTVGQWWAEPDVGRVAHGIPARVDRLRGLGNAVVPQIPELIGRAIMNNATENKS